MILSKNISLLGFWTHRWAYARNVLEDNGGIKNGSLRNKTAGSFHDSKSVSIELAPKVDTENLKKTPDRGSRPSKTANSHHGLDNGNEVSKIYVKQERILLQTEHIALIVGLISITFSFSLFLSGKNLGGGLFLLWSIFVLGSTLFDLDS